MIEGFGDPAGTCSWRTSIDSHGTLDGIKVKPDDVPRPVTKWAQMGLLQATMDVFTRVRYERPTSIQAQAAPISLSTHIDISTVAV